ncbi:hypothetical protein MIND_00026300 [Mycena indigotica]|uniref:Transmembrane protein n=1 Tax=Mycena indigotica TaxID=2126181 RepID=A0A8H6TCT7_9AGAR|nr:uncharacterized protein MIND_00026300 [Mycena indigotica]KAF7315120.1 hypothetical protein MIND_00026300 [Mycena indigotica]
MFQSQTYASNESKARPPQQSAQSYQNQEDEKARRQASRDLTQSWMDRLQLISVITTFFASTEAGLLQVAGNSSASEQVANSTLFSALVLHIWAAILSFLGAFFVVRYRLKEAKEEQKDVVHTAGDPGVSPASRTSTDHSFLRSPLVPVWTTNPHVEEFGPFERKPRMHLLSKIHNLCILLTFAGFALAILGILAIAWGQNPVSVGVLTSVSTAMCLVGAVWVFQ